MARTGFLWGIFALLAFIGSLFIPILNTFLPFLSVIALGWGAGYTAAKVTGAVGGQRLGRGTGAGALAGLVTMIGVVAATALLGQFVRNLILSNPTLQTQIQQLIQQQDPTAANVPIGQILNDPAFTPALLFGGFCFGLIPLVLMAIAGLVGGLMWKGTPTPGEYVAAGRGGGGTSYGGTGTASTYDTSTTTGTGFGATGTTGTASTYDTGSATGTTGYGSTMGTPGTTGDQGEGEGGVRVYDTDDRNRM